MNFHLFIHAHSVRRQTYFRSYEPRKKIHTVKCGAEGFNNWNSRCQILLCLTELFCNIAPQRKSFLAWSILPDVDTVNAEANFRLTSCALEYAWLIYMWFLPVLYIYLQFINFNQEEKSFCANKDMPCRYFFFTPLLEETFLLVLFLETLISWSLMPQSWFIPFLSRNRMPHVNATLLWCSSMLTRYM